MIGRPRPNVKFGYESTRPTVDRLPTCIHEWKVAIMHVNPWNTRHTSDIFRGPSDGMSEKAESYFLCNRGGSFIDHIDLFKFDRKRGSLIRSWNPY